MKPNWGPSLYASGFKKGKGAMIIKVITNDGNDDLFRIGLDTEKSTAHDFITFIESVINLLKKDRCSLESEANKSGRTLNHKLLGAVGSIPKDPL
jgi:hypothetical protein